MDYKKHGKFANTDGLRCQKIHNPLGAIIKYFFTPHKKPKQLEVNFQQNYDSLQNGEFVWFGHSTVLFKHKDKVFLIDPIFISKKQFNYSQQLDLDKLPQIDFLIITHNHIDHMSKLTLQALKSKIKHILIPLNNTRYLQHIYENDMADIQITEFDWNQTQIFDEIAISCLPSRHYSVRDGNDWYDALWGSFCVDNIYISGDTSFQAEMFSHNLEYLEKNNQKADFCFIECGQYNKSWPDNHMFPFQSLQAFSILKGLQYFPYHFGKFALATHKWNEPTHFLNKNAEKCFVGRIGQIYSFLECNSQKKFIDAIWIQ